MKDSEREALVNDLERMRDYAIEKQRHAEATTLQNAISAITQPESQGEPYIWVRRDDKTSVCWDKRFANEDYIPLYTAPASGVRAGMLRAAEICRAQAVGEARPLCNVLAEAITRATEQVNESQPETVQAVKEDAPVMKAWNNYKSCDEFKNTRKWALHEEHVEGSLWAAFYAGFFACAVYEVNTLGQQQPMVDDVRAALLFCLWHHQGGNSKIGQPLRLALGIGRDEPLTDEQLKMAKRVQSALTSAADQVNASQPDTVQVPIEDTRPYVGDESRINVKMCGVWFWLPNSIYEIVRAAQEAK